MVGVAGALVGKVGVARGEAERDADFGGGEDGNRGVSGRLQGLEREMERVRWRREVVEEALVEYAEAEGDGGGGRRGDGMVMRRLGIRYGEVEREVEEVKRDVERLMRRRDGEPADGGDENEDDTWIR